MSGNRKILLSSVFALAGVLSGCGGGDTPAAEPSGGVAAPDVTPITTTTVVTTPTSTTVVTTPTTTTTVVTTPTTTTTVVSTPTTTTPVVATPTMAIAAATLAANYVAGLDAKFATSFPTTGALLASEFDGCYLNDGRTKAKSVIDSDADANLVASIAYRIGSTRSAPAVLAERNTTNPDGSVRREIDIKYVVSYTDGSKDNDARLTLISGSSQGSCATPQASADVREFGNRQLVGFEMRALNSRYDNIYLRNRLVPATAGLSLPYPTTTYSSPTSSATTAFVVPAGAPNVFAPVQYQRAVEFRITDPMSNATYAIISGSGPTSVVGGATTPFSLKMLSPKILRDDALLAGKPGNYTTLLDDSTFKSCRLDSTRISVSATASDCVTYGATGTGYQYLYTPNSDPNAPAQADAAFNAFNFQIGAYTVAIYNDDGWKTVNGHAGKTPIATYTTQLESLPLSFAEMNVAGGQINDKFPKFMSSSLTNAELAAKLAGSTSFAVASTWLAPTTTANGVFRLNFLEEYAEGQITLGVNYPRAYKFTDAYPGSTATQNTGSVKADPANLAFKTQAQIEINYTNRNKARIRTYGVFN